MLNLRLTQPIWFTLFLCHESKGIQDLSSKSAAQDKSCTPEPKMRLKRRLNEKVREQLANLFPPKNYFSDHMMR